MMCIAIFIQSAKKIPALFGSGDAFIRRGGDSTARRVCSHSKTKKSQSCLPVQELP